MESMGYPPTRHTVFIPFGMDDDLCHPDGLFWTFLLMHVVLSKNHTIGVETR